MANEETDLRERRHVVGRVPSHGVPGWRRNHLIRGVQKEAVFNLATNGAPSLQSYEASMIC